MSTPLHSATSDSCLVASVARLCLLLGRLRKILHVIITARVKRMMYNNAYCVNEDMLKTRHHEASYCDH